jgi:hypothetical protein
MSYYRPLLYFIVFVLFPITAFAEVPTEQINAKFKSDKPFQVIEEETGFLVFATSAFHDSQAKRFLGIMSKAVLLRHIKKKDKKVTGIEVRGSEANQYYEKDGGLVAVSVLDKENVTLLYDVQERGQAENEFKREIKRLEAVEPKTKQIHSQLKELYFISGDIENYNKQSDILMEILFNEE